MGQRDCRCSTELVAPADRLAEVAQAEQPPRRKAADHQHEVRSNQAELPFAPERAELLLARCGRAIPAARRRPARVAARDRRAVEGRVELVLVQLEPAAERLPGAAPPGQPLLALDDPGRLAVDVCALARVRLDDRQGEEREALLGAGAADAVVALEGGDRAVRRAAPRQARTATKYVPSWRISPPPSSSARPAPVK